MLCKLTPPLTLNPKPPLTDQPQLLQAAEATKHIRQLLQLVGTPNAQALQQAECPDAAAYVSEV